jgi:type I restriction enzyme, S subunit
MPTKIKQKKKKLIPELRFPGFSGDWGRAGLTKCISSLDAGVSVNSGGRAAVRHENGVLKTSCVGSGHFNPIENKVVNNLDEISRLKESVKGGTIIISRMNTPQLVGANCIIKKDYPNLYLPDRLWSAKIKTTCSVEWLGQYLLVPKTRYRLSARATGTSGSMKNLTKGDLLTLPIDIPPLSEQQKTASFLSSADEWIENLRAHKEKLEEYKKGMMQKIFSQDVRFKNDEGKDFPGWEEKVLGEVIDKHSSSLSAGSIKENLGKYKVYGASGELKSVDFFLESEPYISIVKDGAGVGRLLMCEATTSVLGTLDVLKPKVGDSLSFLYFLLSRINFNTYVTGSTIPHIYFNHYKKEKVLLPSLVEQNKISDFLSSLDNLIDSKLNQVSLAEEWKKGLMQGLFV